MIDKKSCPQVEEYELADEIHHLHAHGLSQGWVLLHVPRLTVDLYLATQRMVFRHFRGARERFVCHNRRPPGPPERRSSPGKEAEDLVGPFVSWRAQLVVYPFCRN